MSAAAQPDEPRGRLPLLRPDELDGSTLELYGQISALVESESTEAGYIGQLADGRLLGPFNAMLFTPALTGGLAQWIRQIGVAGLDPHVREAIILTVGGRWNADFEIYAHTAGARSAGLSESIIDDLIAGRPLRGATPQLVLAQRLTLALVVDHAVPDELYGEVVEAFGVERTIAFLNLIAQYQLISSLLVLFDVPAPAD